LAFIGEAYSPLYCQSGVNLFGTLASRIMSALKDQRTAIADIFVGVDIRPPLALALKQRALNYMIRQRGKSQNSDVEQVMGFDL